MTTTDQRIADMLTENTGRHFLDSGGAHGRHWERNQSMDLEHWQAAPDVWLTSWRDYTDVYPTKSLFHHLSENLYYTDALGDVFDDFIAHFPSDHPWLVEIDRFLAAIDQLMEYGMREWHWSEIAETEILDLESNHSQWLHVTDALYGENDGPWGFNSYNDDDILTQTIQGSMFSLDDTVTINGYTLDMPMVLLQIHGGADVRGGYTRPVLFEFAHGGAEEFLSWNRAYISDDEGNSMEYDTYDGWRCDGVSWDQRDIDRSDDTVERLRQWTALALIAIKNGDLPPDYDDDAVIKGWPIDSDGHLLHPESMLPLLAEVRQ